MAQVKLNFDKKTIPQKLAQAELVVTKCTGNPIAPDVGLVAAVQQKAYNLNLSASAALAAEAAAKAAHATQDADVVALDAAYAALGGNVQQKSDGDEAKILSTGYEVRSSSHAPVVLVAPSHLSVTMGDLAGELDVTCDPVRGAVGYQGQYTTDLTGATGWQNAPFSTSSRTTFQGLVSGTRYAVRLQAVSAGQHGPWSEIVQKMAP